MYATQIKWQGPFLDKSERGIWRTNYMRIEHGYLRLNVSVKKFRTPTIEFKLAFSENQKLWVTGKVLHLEDRCRYPEKYVTIIETFSIGKFKEKRHLVVLYDQERHERDRLMPEGTLFGGYIRSKKIEDVKLIPTANLWLREGEGAIFSDLDLHHVQRTTKGGKKRWTIEHAEKQEWAPFGPNWIQRQLISLKDY